MVSRQEVFDFVKDTYDVEADYPWEIHPHYAALRHRGNKKWFALIMDISKDKIGLEGNEIVDVINLKARQELVGSLQKKEGIYKAYHMDKTHWISVNLNEINNLQDIEDLIEESFELTE